MRGTNGVADGIRVGVDVVDVAEVADAVARHGSRYLERIYTEHELASCRRPAPDGGPGRTYAADGLAARFAAKEAVVKVLRPTGPRPAWRAIEVRRHPDGWCRIDLEGRAAELADDEGITGLAVSLTHQGPVAAAVVVATTADGAEAPRDAETPRDEETS